MFLFFSNGALFAQKIVYNYDDHGNRTERVIYLDSKKSANGGNGSQTDQGGDTEEFKEKFENNGKEISLNIYPNPVDQILNIVIDTEDFPDGKIYIYDINGKIIVSINNLSYTNSLDVSAYPDGIYFLKIEVNGKYSDWKIIKNR